MLLLVRVAKQGVRPVAVKQCALGPCPFREVTISAGVCRQIFLDLFRDKVAVGSRVLWRAVSRLVRTVG